jgi:hypothetical protein
MLQFFTLKLSFVSAVVQQRNQVEDLFVRNAEKDGSLLFAEARRNQVDRADVNVDERQQALDVGGLAELYAANVDQRL